MAGSATRLWPTSANSRDNNQPSSLATHAAAIRAAVEAPEAAERGQHGGDGGGERNAQIERVDPRPSTSTCPSCSRRRDARRRPACARARQTKAERHTSFANTSAIPEIASTYSTSRMM